MSARASAEKVACGNPTLSSSALSVVTGFPFGKSAHRLGGELGDAYRVRDAALQVFVCAECERRQKARLRNEDQVVVLRFRCCFTSR